MVFVYFEDSVRPARGDRGSVAELVRADDLGLLSGVFEADTRDQFAEVVAGVADLLQGEEVGGQPAEFGI